MKNGQFEFRRPCVGCLRLSGDSRFLNEWLVGAIKCVLRAMWPLSAHNQTGRVYA